MVKTELQQGFTVPQVAEIVVSSMSHQVWQC